MLLLLRLSISAIPTTTANTAATPRGTFPWGSKGNVPLPPLGERSPRGGSQGNVPLGEQPFPWGKRVPLGENHPKKQRSPAKSSVPLGKKKQVPQGNLCQKNPLGNVPLECVSFPRFPWGTKKKFPWATFPRGPSPGGMSFLRELCLLVCSRYLRLSATGAWR